MWWFDKYPERERETRVGDCGKKLGHPRVHIHTHRCDTEQAVYISYQLNCRSFRQHREK